MHRLIILLILAPGLALPLSAQQHNALVLYSYHDALPWQNGVRAGIQERLLIYSERLSMEIYEESLDSVRVMDESTTEDWIRYIKTKYRNIDFEMVITESEATAAFLHDHPNLYPDARRYFVNPGREMLKMGLSNSIFVDEDIEQALRVTLEMRPDTRKIIAIGNLDLVRVENVRAAWSRNHRDQVEFESWTGNFTFNELNRRVANLPPDVVIFYALVNHDSTGATVTPYAALEQLAQSASVPVFVMHDTLLGSGAVGGHVQSAQKVGWAIADLIMGAQPKDFSTEFFSLNLFDERALQRWQIPSKLIPDDSKILYQDHSIWEEHKFEISMALLFALIETLLLVLLFHALRGKRLALTSLSAAHGEMEKRVDERTAQLRQANAALEKATIVDELTQLSNRRRFDDVLNKEYKRLRRSGAVLSLILLDLDCFKGLNDSLGHVAGDECLISVGKILSSAAGRATDLAARYGGEEFAIILPETDFNGAYSLAEEIRLRIIDSDISNPASTIRNCVTASLGVVSVTAANVGAVKDIIELADEQLYIGKNNGRNRVEGRDYATATDTKGKHRTNVIELPLTRE